MLYGVLSKGSHCLIVEEFFHYYRPSEIVKSKGYLQFPSKETIAKAGVRDSKLKLEREEPVFLHPVRELGTSP